MGILSKWKYRLHTSRRPIRYFVRTVIGNWTYFITGGAARFELLGVVSLAVELILVNTVGQIDEEFVAGVTLETGRVPSHAFAELGCHDAHRTRRNVTVAPVTLLQSNLCYYVNVS